MIKSKQSRKYDFVSRSIGSVSTHDFDWDLETYFQMNGKENECSDTYDIHREILFRAAVGVSDELGGLIAECGMKGECRARVIAVLVENLPTLPSGVGPRWLEVYDMKRPRFNPDLEGASLYRVVITISQTHSNDFFSDKLRRNFQLELAERLEANLGMSRGINYPFSVARDFSRSDILIPSLRNEELPKRAEAPESFGFHEAGDLASQGLTTFRDTWSGVKDGWRPHLCLQAQFTTAVPSPGSIQVTRGVEASEVLLETLMSASYQFGMLRATRGFPLSWRYRQISLAEASIVGFTSLKHIKGNIAALVNVSIWSPLDADRPLNQALRNKLRFFIDKDVRKTFGLRPDELGLSNPHIQALVNNVFIKQYESAGGLYGCFAK